jgi:hypothetical protein
VLKSRLEVDPGTAPAVQMYLRARAGGLRRALAAERAGLERYSPGSLVGIEWNALQYAGATVWNCLQPREKGGYVGGTKRRPRAEWEVKEGTHEALITQDEAERLLAHLVAYSATHARRSSADYLLTGLLRTAAGDTWRGQGGKYYRTGNRLVPARDVDASVLDQVRADLRSRDFAGRVLQLKDKLRALLAGLKADGKRIAAYGAAAKGSTLLNTFGIGAETLEFVADRSTHKQGRLMPGVRIPIVAPEMLATSMPHYTLLLTWNFADEILRQQTDYRSRGGKFIVPVPDVSVV